MLDGVLFHYLLECANVMLLLTTMYNTKVTGFIIVVPSVTIIIILNSGKEYPIICTINLPRNKKGKKRGINLPE